MKERKKLKEKKQRSEKEIQYQRDYYKKNKEKIMGQHKDYNEKNKDKVAAYKKEWAEKNRDRVKENFNRWVSENIDKYKESSKQYAAKNKARVYKHKKAWKAKNGHAVREGTQRRNAAKIRATPAWADKGKMVSIYEEAALLTRTTGIKHHVDHVVPLRSNLVCGLHCEENLRVVTAHENLTKSNRSWPFMPEEKD